MKVLLSAGYSALILSHGGVTVANVSEESESSALQ